MQNDSLMTFFETWENVPTTSEIFQSLRKMKIFDGTDFDKKDVANLMAVATLMESICYLFANNKEDERYIANMSEIYGTYAYERKPRSVGAFMFDAFRKYIPNKAGSHLEDYPRLAKGVKLEKCDSVLDVKFKNLEQFLVLNNAISGVRVYYRFKAFATNSEVQNLALAIATYLIEDDRYWTTLNNRNKRLFEFIEDTNIVVIDSNSNCDVKPFESSI